MALTNRCCSTWGVAFYTWREAFIGFVLGALLGLLLATIFVHFRPRGRAFVPYVVASQTILIVALAPMIVYAFRRASRASSSSPCT